MTAIHSSETNRLTVEALRFYVPIFQEADIFYELNSGNVTPENRALIEASYALREMAIDYILDLAKPLVVREINKLISTSHIRKNDKSLFDLLFYAARGGAVRGLRHFEVDKLDQSATNYLFMWLTTYAKKELNALEAAPFGIPPIRFNNYKKISAVRKRLSEQFGRYATNEEVLQEFQSGGADMKTMNGRKSNKGPSKANQRMTLELIEEQEHFEKHLISQNLIDPLDAQATKSVYGEVSTTPFSETLFGTFLDAYPFTPEARVALISELQGNMTPQEISMLQALEASELKKLSMRWKLLLRDSHGPFAEFLETVKNDGFTELDIHKILNSIKEQEGLVKRSQWEILLQEPYRTIKPRKKRTERKQ